MHHAATGVRPDTPPHRASSPRPHASPRRPVRRATPRATPRAAADRSVRRRSRRSASGRPPCAPTPGTRTGPPSALTSGGVDSVAPTTTPTDPGSGDAARLTAAAASTIDCATVRPSVCAHCTLAPSGLDVAARTNTPRPCAGSAVQQRLQRAESEVGRCGDGVDGQRRITGPRGGVGGHRRADVAALGVGQHQHACVAQRGDGVLQHRIARRAVGLEERHLRFDHRETGERRDTGVAELAQPVGVGRQAPRGQQLGMGVDARAERTALRHRVGQPATKPDRGSSQAGPSALCSSCSDITPMSPRMPASMPCTAADAPCTVVTHGMFIATAAERIS